jgi:hypothetical protein
MGTFRIFKDGEWKDATKEDIKESMKDSYGIEIDDISKIKVRINDVWVSGDKLVKE